jgi:two-component system CheB/CheR fusion protein
MAAHPECAGARQDLSHFTRAEANPGVCVACKAVFIVSQDPALRDWLSELVASAGLRAETLPSMEAWLEAAEPEPQGCLVLDAGGGELVEPDRLASFATVCTRIPALVLTDRGDVPTAVGAMKHGAADVLQKPLWEANVLERIKRAVEEKWGATG